MRILDLHRKLLIGNCSGLSVVLTLSTLIYGLDRAIWDTFQWLALTILCSFLVFRTSVAQSIDDRADTKVDGSPVEKSMLMIVVWTPAVMLACLFAATLVSRSLFDSLGWMVMAIGFFIGRDIEAVIRLRKDVK